MREKVYEALLKVPEQKFVQVIADGFIVTFPYVLFAEGIRLSDVQAALESVTAVKVMVVPIDDATIKVLLI